LEYGVAENKSELRSQLPCNATQLGNAQEPKQLYPAIRYTTEVPESRGMQTYFDTFVSTISPKIPLSVGLLGGPEAGISRCDSAIVEQICTLFCFCVVLER
jgi:hypothetical protein